ncbi:MAG: hypothetical protein IT383_18110 [Deltaproteobacteria bacterium]|nr:hypothetical protein [Deltaproteobacteria bacterium]
MIDTLLGMLFLFFGLATVTSFLQERLASLFGWRQRNLYRALQGMLESPDDPLTQNESRIASLARDLGGTLLSWLRKRPSGAVDLLLQDPTVRALRGKGWFGLKLRRAPSYLPRDIFVGAAKRIGQDMSRGLSEDAYKVLNAYSDREIGDWFDATMDRCGGWYRRQTQVALVLIATALVIGCNIDALHIGRALMVNATLRDTLALEAQAQAAARADAATTVKALQVLLDKSGAELGLTVSCDEDSGLWGCAINNVGTNLQAAKRHALGWLIAILAAAAGAPFWFDLLTRVAHLRAAGPAPQQPAPRRSKGGEDSDGNA